MRTLGGMQPQQSQQPMVKGAYRGLFSKRTAPSLRKIINSQFIEKLLEDKEFSGNLLE